MCRWPDGYSASLRLTGSVWTRVEQELSIIMNVFVAGYCRTSGWTMERGERRGVEHMDAKPFSSSLGPCEASRLPR